MKVKGQEFLWRPFPTLEKWRSEPKLGGIPLLAPWANRLDQDAFFANGKKFLLNAGLGNLRRDANGLPIHGLVLFTDRWEIVHQGAHSVTSRLEFWRVPEWMAQFPFAHTIEVTHRLNDSTLEVETTVQNHSSEPMPLSLGYHPYFTLPDSRRDDWKVQIAAKKRAILSDKKIPTAEHVPASSALESLAGRSLDDVFPSLTGDPFLIKSKTQQIEVRFGPKFPIAVIYAPPEQPFICVEPMTVETDAWNRAAAGEKVALQQVAPNSSWRESFWIKPE